VLSMRARIRPSETPMATLATVQRTVNPRVQ